MFLALFLTLNASQNSFENRPSDSLQKVSLQLHWKYQFQFAGFIVAKEKGFYKEVGLDVDLKEYEYGTDILHDVLSQKSNYGIYNSNILLEYLNKKSIKLLSSYFKRSALVLITKKGIKSPEDLIGKTIMSAGIDDFKLNFQAMFDEFDVDINKLKFVKHTYNIKDFEKVDAMTAFISDQPYKLDKLGIEYNIINPSDLGLFNLQLELFTSDEEIKNHFNRTKAFRDASLKGWTYALEHKEEVIDIIHQKYAQHISLDELRNEAVEIEKLILPKTYNLGSIDKNFLDKQLEMFKFYNKISEEIGLDDFLYENLENKNLNLTLKEIKYLSEHKNLKLCSSSNILPFDEHIDEKYAGIMNDIFKVINEKLGINIEAKKFLNHKELQENIRSGECQLVSTVIADNINFDGVVASKIFYKTNFTLVSSIDKSFVSDIENLKGKKLIVNSEIYKKKLLHTYPFLDLIVEEDRLKMMKKVIAGKVYGVITFNESADYLIDKYGYGKLKINGFLSKNILVPLSIGVSTQERNLLPIINKTLDTISDDKIDTIVKNWRITRYNEKVDYTLVFYILVGVFIVLVIMAYYQKKLRNFNQKLEQQVAIKTVELRQLNESLELTVQEKIEELIKKDKILTMQSKQAVMGEMISMIAHQWRQPLSTITLQISNLQVNRLLGNEIADETIDKTLERISDSIIYLSDTIDDFQTYFRPNRVASDVKVDEFMAKVISLAEAKIKSSNVNVITDFPYNDTIKIYTNELIQVILNILNNAVDAFKDVQREEQNILISCREVGDKIAISIADNASGIKEENLKNLFDPYFSTKGKNGTGLGLYMSQMIIQKQFGGAIDVSSSPAGTTFSVTIPKSLD